MNYGVHWELEARTITLNQDDESITMRPESAWHLIVMAARMLRGYDVPEPYTVEEMERIALARVRRELGEVEIIAAEAGPMFDEDDKEAIRDSLDSASGTVMELSNLINRLRSETGIDR